MFLNLNTEGSRQNNKVEQRKSLWQLTWYVVINSLNIRWFLFLFMYFDTHQRLFASLPKVCPVFVTIDLYHCLFLSDADCFGCFCCHGRFLC